MHGAEVFLSMYFFLFNLEVSLSINSLDLICLLIAGCGHDVGHPGLTNRYLVQTRDKLAMQYNDTSVLENMHCSVLFSLMIPDHSDLLSRLSEEEWINCRAMILGMVLGTDLSKHFEILSKFRNRAQVLADIAIDRFEDRVLVFSMALKCSDIGHSAKSRELHQKWTSLVMEEFFCQGDLEKTQKLSVSMYCDRNNTDIPKSQAGFIKNICIPLYEIWCNYLKSSVCDATFNQLRENYQYWEEYVKTKKVSEVTRLKVDDL